MHAQRACLHIRRTTAVEYNPHNNRPGIMERIRLPYQQTDLVLVDDEGQEFTVDVNLYKVLYAFSPSIVKLPSHIRFGPAAGNLLMECDTVKEPFKASWYGCSFLYVSVR